MLQIAIICQIVIDMVKYQNKIIVPYFPIIKLKKHQLLLILGKISVNICNFNRYCLHRAPTSHILLYWHLKLGKTRVIQIEKNVV